MRAALHRDSNLRASPALTRAHDTFADRALTHSHHYDHLERRDDRHLCFNATGPNLSPTYTLDTGAAGGNVFDPSHPSWDEREQRLQKLYVAAGKEYDRLWPDRYASPGGNSPIVVYVGSPTAKRGTTGELEVLIPLHCQNLIGSVEVVLRFAAPNSGFPTELRQFTGCTSNRTLIIFILPSPEVHRRGRVQPEISVLDESGALLTHSLAPIPVR
ncbi:MAG: hypothetical protein WA383_18870 [Terriglobales bacterium]